MITTVSCDLLLQVTCLLVNLSTRQLQIMITTVSCDLLLQATCLLVNLSTRQLPLMGTEYYCNKGDDRITIIQKKVQKTDLYFYP